MTVNNWQVRRATLDDLVVLRRLWQQAGWPAAELEKGFREFQVVETARGEVHGAIGLRVNSPHGHVHSEAYQPPELADELRPRLWERVLSVARHHGLGRLWIADPSSMFWLEKGFEVAGRELTAKLPETWREREDQRWLTLKLREETVPSALIDQELAVFQQAQMAERERVAQRTRLFRAFAVVVVAGVLLLMGWAAWVIMVHLHRGPVR
jgi:N-acetylglutamate synthase-like GNAT family acetyltransferase